MTERKPPVDRRPAARGAQAAGTGPTSPSRATEPSFRSFDLLLVIGVVVMVVGVALAMPRARGLGAAAAAARTVRRDTAVALTLEAIAAVSILVVLALVAMWVVRRRASAPPTPR